VTIRNEGWDTALDAQTSLLRSFGTLEGREYLDGFVRALIRAGAYDPLTGDYTNVNLDDYASNLVHLVTTSLPECDPFYVSGDLVELIDFAAEKFRPEPLILNDLMVPDGFAYFAKPVYVTDTRGLQMPFRAFEWSINPERTGLLIALYSHRGDGDPTDDGVYHDSRVGGSDLVLEYATFMRFEQASTVYDDDETIRDVLAHVKVFFRLCQQEVAIPFRERASRPVWKRAKATWRDIREVVVFTLRRAKNTPEYEGDEREVQWSHRWMVQGHWRNQPYIERDDDGTRRTIYRQIWIAPYVKGPDGKPLIFKRRVFELVR
jgi:hypothetical protein